MCIIVVFVYFTATIIVIIGNDEGSIKLPSHSLYNTNLHLINGIEIMQELAYNNLVFSVQHEMSSFHQTSHFRKTIKTVLNARLNSACRNLLKSEWNIRRNMLLKLTWSVILLKSWKLVFSYNTTQYTVTLSSSLLIPNKSFRTSCFRIPTHTTALICLFFVTQKIDILLPIYCPTRSSTYKCSAQDILTSLEILGAVCVIDQLSCHFILLFHLTTIYL